MDMLKRKILYTIIIIIASGITLSIITDFWPVNVIGNLSNIREIPVMSTNQTQVMSTNQTMKMIIVPYFEPENPQWETIYQLADRYPGTIEYVIINPCSGPCKIPLSDNWQQIISKLKNKNIKTLGYIFNDAESKINIDYYMKQPIIPTDGIFFDNEGSTYNVDNFTQYANYVHSLGGIVYINPGYTYQRLLDYITNNLADVVDIHEFGFDKPDYIEGNYDAPSSKISTIVGNVFNTSDMKTELTEIASKGIGIVYIYAESYYTIPSYFNEEIQQVSNTTIAKH